MSAGLPSTRILPRSSTMARSTSGITISITCSTISTVTPVARTRRTSSTPVSARGGAGGAQFDAGVPLDRGQAGQPLVEQQQFRLGRQGTRDFEPAFFRWNEV